MSAFIDLRIGNCPRYYLRPPKDRWMRIPDFALNCVAFIGLRKGFDPVMGATCFFLRVPSARLPERSFCYVCTAAHVVDKLNGGDWVIRANKRGGGVQIIEGMTGGDDGGPVKWWRHPHNDGTVDFAVCPLAPELNGALQINPFPIQGLATPDVIKDEQIGAGDEVWIPSLFQDVIGEAGNTPVVRSGNVALVSSEKIPWNTRLINAHLIESRSTSGHSGSPVFVHPSFRFGAPRHRPDGSAEHHVSEDLLTAGFVSYCFGTMIGHWEETGRDQFLKGVNKGIAAVVPAQQMLQVIHQPDLLQLRSDQEAAWMADSGAVND